MLWTAGSLSGVIAVYLAIIYWARATKAHKSGPQWGLGALVVYLAIMGVIYVVIRLLGLQDYMQIWISCVLWFIVTLAAGAKTDSIFAEKLPIADS